VPLPQDINFDGTIESSLQGYDDWGNIDLRQSGATGNDFWAGGARPTVVGGARPTVVGGARPTVVGGARPTVVGGVVQITRKTATNTCPPPQQLSEMLPASNTVLLSWTTPAFPQTQIAAFNIYRTPPTPPAFSKPAYTTVTVTGPLPLPNPFTFTDAR